MTHRDREHVKKQRAIPCIEGGAEGLTVTEECQLKHIEEFKMMHLNYSHASLNDGDTF